MNAARYAKRLKEIRRVKAAIKFQEAARERREPLKAIRKEITDYQKYRAASGAANKYDEKQARRRVKEDWALGSLRPNRAIGQDAERYGALVREQARLPPLPEYWYGAGLELQKKIPEKLPKHVLLNQWPIVEKDRVVVIRGRQKNKVGVVSKVEKRSNEVTIEGLNKVFFDGKLFTLPNNQETDARQESLQGISYDDIRLIVPHFVPAENNPNVRVRRDVIVEDVEMERHTFGTNPLTREEHDLTEIPEEEAVDPITGETLWHRYIAGTRTRLEWPWEESEQKKLDRKEELDQETSLLEDHIAPKSRWESIKTLGGYLGSSQKQTASTTSASSNRDPKPFDQSKALHGQPEQWPPAKYSDDVSPDMMNDNSLQNDMWEPTLKLQPIPPTIMDELKNIQLDSEIEVAEAREKKRRDQSQISDEERQRRRESKKNVAAFSRLVQQEKKERLLTSMKTPKQIKWELEQAQKIKYEPFAEVPPSEEMLEALGRYMTANEKKASTHVLQNRAKQLDSASS